jgi:hypothetical protein
MPQAASRSGSKNRVLARLARADLALLKPHLAPVELPVPTRLEMANARMDNVFFIERGFASVVADGPGKRSIEGGIIGREGMTGLALVLGHDRSTHETYMQAAGSAAHQCRPFAQGHGSERPLASLASALRPFLPRPDHANGAGQRSQQAGGAPGPLAAHGAGSH